MKTVDETLPKTDDSPVQAAHPEAKEPSPSWISRYWGFWLVMAFIVYETTSQPALATLIACIKVGWDEFSMAGWLLRVDPDRKNVFSKMALYIGYGLWKIAIAACLVLIGVVFLLNTFQPRGGAPLFMVVIMTIRGSLAALMLGFVLSTFFTLLAFITALLGGGRLYVGQAVSAARAGRYWPPVTVERGILGLNLGNFSRWLLISAFFMVYAIFGLVVTQRILAGDPNNARKETKTMLFLSTLGLTCMAGYLYLNWKVAAVKPEDCWKLPDWAKSEPETDDGDSLAVLPDAT